MIFFGNTEKPRGYVGIRQPDRNYDLVGPLRFTAVSAGSTIGMTHYGTNQSSTKPVLYWSLDGENWTLWDYTTINIGGEGSVVYMYGDNPTGVSHSGNNYSQFTMTGSISAHGDCTTLLSENGTTDLSSCNYVFYRLFYRCSALTSAPALPSTTLAQYCYYQMFRDCTALTSAPALPAETLAIGCYQNMFFGCTALASTPELPARTLADNCYSEMFRDCTALTSAPALPATTLVFACYHTMFFGCTALTSAPALPATTLASYCYYNMFYNCANLSYIYTKMTNTTATYCLANWVSGVSPTGDFYCDESLSLATGASGMPSGWTRHDI